MSAGLAPLRLPAIGAKPCERQISVRPKRKHVEHAAGVEHERCWKRADEGNRRSRRRSARMKSLHGANPRPIRVGVRPPKTVPLKTPHGSATNAARAAKLEGDQSETKSCIARTKKPSITRTAETQNRRHERYGVGEACSCLRPSPTVRPKSSTPMLADASWIVEIGHAHTHCRRHWRPSMCAGADG